MNHNKLLTRRDFLKTASAAALAIGLNAFCAEKEPKTRIVIFSKIYQPLKLKFDESAELTAMAGYDGVDCPVREGGEIEPKNVEKELPSYAEELKKRGCNTLLLTSGITSIKSPFAENVLKTAKKSGIKYYRLGMSYHRDDEPLQKQIDRKKEELKELAALNRKIGITAIFQNHSPTGKQIYFGGNIDELHELIKDIDPNEIGVAFDLAHAIIVHGDDWRSKFDLIKSHFKIAYIKDVKRPRSFVPFGEGEFSKSDYFKILKKIGYNEPYSIHIEFDYAGKGNPPSKEALLKAMINCKEMLKRWLDEA
ncbi:MAG: TIM barrel protein [Verrucomicrobiae bacterium]|nr:TIM barrel protein [Verrucomicrobiae bacterium]